MSGLRVWLGKEWRENRLILGIWFLLSPLMVAVPGWLAGGQEGFRYPWEVSVTIFVGVGLLVLLLAVGLFCVERRRDRLDWLRRTPGGLRNAYGAKMLLYLGSVLLAYVWMAFLAGSAAGPLGAYTPQDGAGPLPTFLWLEYPLQELMVVGLGAGLWLVLSSIVFGVGAFNIAFGPMLMVLFCLPLFWWSSKHPWFLSIEQPGVPWRLGVIMIVLGLGCGAWAWLRGMRHANDRARVFRLGLLPILLVFACGTAYGFHALHEYESLDLSQDDVHIGLGEDSRALVTVSPNGRYLYAYLYRSNVYGKRDKSFPKPWRVHFADDPHDPRPRDAFDVRVTPMRPYRFDLQSGDAEPMGEMQTYFHAEPAKWPSTRIARPLVRSVLFVGHARHSSDELGRVETDTGVQTRIELPADYPQLRAKLAALQQEAVASGARVRDERGRLAWLKGTEIRFEDGESLDLAPGSAALVSRTDWRMEVPGGWVFGNYVSTLDANDGKLRNSDPRETGLPRTVQFVSPHEYLGFRPTADGNDHVPVLCDLDAGTAERIPAGEGLRTSWSHGSRGRVGELLRLMTHEDGRVLLNGWRAGEATGTSIPIDGLAALPDDPQMVAALQNVHYDAFGNAILSVYWVRSGAPRHKWIVATTWLLLPAKAERARALGGWRRGDRDKQLHPIAIQQDGRALFLEADPTEKQRAVIVRYDAAGTREQLIPKPQ